MFLLGFNFYAVAILRLSMSGDLKVLIGQHGVVRKKVTESFSRSTDYQTLDASTKKKCYFRVP